MNHCSHIGRMTKDCELKTTGNKGISVLNFTLAVDRRFKQEGQPTADFLNYVAFDKAAEIIAKYCGKGSMLGVDSRVQNRNWTDADGNKHYATDFIVESFTFAGGKSNNQSNAEPEEDEDQEFNLDDLQL